MKDDIVSIEMRIVTIVLIMYYPIIIYVPITIYIIIAMVPYFFNLSSLNEVYFYDRKTKRIYIKTLICPHL